MLGICEQENFKHEDRRSCFNDTKLVSFAKHFKSLGRSELREKFNLEEQDRLWN